MRPKDYLSVKSCKRCGKLFQTVVDINICHTCYQKAEEKFKVVKTFIRDNPEAPMYEIAEICDVSERQIMTWIREERLMVKSESGIIIECLQCGVPIKTGRYCQKCKTRMMTELRGVYQEPELTDNSKKFLKEHKMRFMNTKRRR